MLFKAISLGKVTSFRAKLFAIFVDSALSGMSLSHDFLECKYSVGEMIKKI